MKEEEMITILFSDGTRTKQSVEDFRKYKHLLQYFKGYYIMNG